MIMSPLSNICEASFEREAVDPEGQGTPGEDDGILDAGFWGVMSPASSEREVVRGFLTFLVQ